MSLDAGPGDRPTAAGGGNSVGPGGEQGKPADAPVAMLTSQQRLRLNPNKDHKPDSYEDLQLDFSPVIFSSLERYLPPGMLAVDRDDKVKFMREILLKYLPHGERNRVCDLFFSITDWVFDLNPLRMRSFCPISPIDLEITQSEYKIVPLNREFEAKGEIQGPLVSRNCLSAASLTFSKIVAVGELGFPLNGCLLSSPCITQKWQA